MARIFLAYARADNQTVRQLKKDLLAAGHEAWIDDDEVLVGDSIPAKVIQGLAASDFVVICLSQAAIQSGWVAHELANAVMRQFSDNIKRVLPIRLQEVPPPELIKHLAYVDLFPAGEAYSKGMAKLLASIEVALSNPQSHPEPRPRGGTPQPIFEGPGAVPVVEVPHFLGRDTELQYLLEVLAGSDDAVCVTATGLGGIGKTALVHQFIATSAQELFPAGAAWLDGMALPVELARVASRLGWQPDLTTPPEEIARWLAHTLHQQRFLLVVDNFALEHAPISWLPIPGGRCKTVITTRTLLLDEDLGKPARRLRLDCWNEEICRLYIRDVAPSMEAVPDAELDALARFVGGLPLAIRLISKLLRRSGVTPSSLLARLEREPVRTMDTVARGADRGIDATFQVAFAELSDLERKVLLALAACARNTSAAMVAGVVHEETTEEVLHRLEEISLAEFTGRAVQPWSLHDVVRYFIRQQPGAREAVAAHRHFVIVCYNMIVSDEDETTTEAPAIELPRTILLRRALEPEVLSAIDNAIRLQDGESAAQLLLVMSAILAGCTPYGELKDKVEKTLSLLPENQSAADLLIHLGRYCFSLGQVSEALAHLKHALTLQEKFGQIEQQAHTHAHLGFCYRTLGDIPPALEHLKRTHELFEKLGDSLGSAEALAAIGNCYRSMGDPRKGLEFAKQALESVGTEGQGNSQLMPLLYMAHCYLDLNNIPEARNHYQQALKISEAFGHTDQTAAVLTGLGSCYSHEGQVQQAISYHSRALKLNEETGRIEGQAAALNNLAKTLRGC